ncbi:MAG: CPBP family intramembrane glutamic endopeptidase [Bacteroidota bacterium]
MDIPKQPILDSLTPFTRILFSILLVISCFSLIFFIGILLAKPFFGVGFKEILSSLSDYENPTSLKLLQYFQVIQSFGLFIIPPMLAGYFFERSSTGYLRINNPSRWPLYLFTLLLMFCSLPFINWMVSVNDLMKLPEFLHGLEEWMKSTEEEASKLTEAFMRMPTLGGFLFNMLMIAVLPAIGEEFMFRGLLQRLLKDWLGNIHLAIFVSALLFSAMHMQFYGFFPRMVLGIMFGYMFYWTGSLWIPIFAHFIQNGLVVTVTYMGQRGLVGGDYENFGTSDHFYVILLSGISVAALLYLIYRWKQKQFGES